MEEHYSAVSLKARAERLSRNKEEGSLLKDEVKVGLEVTTTLGSRIGTADRKVVWEGRPELFRLLPDFGCPCENKSSLSLVRK